MLGRLPWLLRRRSRSQRIAYYLPREPKQFGTSLQPFPQDLGTRIDKVSGDIGSTLNRIANPIGDPPKHIANSSYGVLQQVPCSLCY